jgi:hypothetical protein
MTTHMIKTFIVTAGIAAAPMLGSAANRPAAMDSCVSAFMQSMAAHSTPLKLSRSRYLTSGPSEGNSNELVLIATDVHDHHTVGRALCKVDAHGQVLHLEEVPVRSLPLL